MRTRDLLRLLRTHLEASGGIRPGVHHVHALHDAECRRPEGSPCTCTPDLASRTPHPDQGGPDDDS